MVATRSGLAMALAIVLAVVAGVVGGLALATLLMYLDERRARRSGAW
ncbi:MAG: hypothetical protein Q8O40_09680 [Chloroflexota bacterium]|nr:hypothetical protein [Chloroflexota bacterium]